VWARAEWAAFLIILAPSIGKAAEYLDAPIARAHWKGTRPLQGNNFGGETVGRIIRECRAPPKWIKTSLINGTNDEASRSIFQFFHIREFCYLFFRPFGREDRFAYPYSRRQIQILAAQAFLPLAKGLGYFRSFIGNGIYIDAASRTAAFINQNNIECWSYHSVFKVQRASYFRFYGEPRAICPNKRFAQSFIGTQKHIGASYRRDSQYYGRYTEYARPSRNDFVIAGFFVFFGLLIGIAGYLALEIFDDWRGTLLYRFGLVVAWLTGRIGMAFIS
jgi:hypothetical protein